MRIGIIETGRPPETLQAKHGSYPDMFIALLAESNPDLDFTTFAAIDGEVPDDPTACDGWLITGSRHGVYERLPWMEKLARLIRGAAAAKVPTVGICFGHQIMADALGGKVEKSDKGWGLGLHVYDVAGRPRFMPDAPARITVPAVHQDQVVALPDGATVVASSAFCPYAAIAYDDTGLSFQGHPEFTEAYQRDLIAARRGSIIPAPAADAGLASLGVGKADSTLLARWIGQFLRRQQQQAAA